MRGFVNPPVAEAFGAESLGGEEGPFYPSAARTADGRPVPADHAERLAGASCAGCHPRQAAEWASSAHRWSGVADPWYRQTLESFREDRGPVAARWCAGCHDPALLLTGVADQPPSDLASLDAASIGVGCTLCHGIVEAGSTIGQGHYVLAALGELGATAGLGSGRLEALRVRLAPDSHARAWAGPALTGPHVSVTCSTCHKAHLEGPLNGHRYLESLNDYDAWQAASVSGHGARSFYWPERPQGCVDCHMPQRSEAEGGGRSHRFAAADTTAALLAGDDQQLAAVAAVLGGGHVSVDLFALSETPADGGAPRLRAAPLDGPQPAQVRPGESVRVDAVVRVSGVGHLFPGGKNADVDAWLEVRAVDGAGRTILASGVLDEDAGPIDPEAHFFRRRRSDGEGRPVELRDDWRARAELYNQSIQPNTADVVRYRLELPAELESPVRLTARLLYRQHTWAFDRWVREQSDEELPELPILTVAEDEVTLQVSEHGADASMVAMRREDRDRWNDYGIGLLLQGDLRGARQAFERVTEIDAEWVDGWVNVARVTTTEGDVDGVEAALSRAEALAPDLARVRYYRGRLEQSVGDLEAASESLRAIVAEYPGDRLVRAQLGQLLMLMGEPEAAAEEFEAVLDVDSESAAGHLNVSQAYRAAGDAERADQHLELYERFRRDEEARALARSYLESHPDDNRERQAIHEHRGRPLPLAGAVAR